MKSKSGVKLKIGILLAVAFFALALVVVPYAKQDGKVFSATFTNSEISAYDENGVCLTVEKVGLAYIDADNSGDYYTQDDFKTEFSLGEIQTIKSAPAREGDYYYADYYGTDKKYVIKDGQYVMLNNQRSGNTYQSEHFSSGTYNGSAVSIQEGILITFGQLAFSDVNDNGVVDNEELASKSIVGAPLIVEGYHNGNAMTLPNARMNGNMRDFAFVIAQHDDNEGHYRFVFNYFVNEKQFNFEFSFYIVNKVSYSGEVIYDNGVNAYRIEPTLRYANGNDLTNKAGKYIYNLGSSNDYPVITYDYTRYKMSYKHTANGVVSNYEYAFAEERGVNYLVCTKTCAGEVETTRYSLDCYSKSKTNNLAVVLLSDIGVYQFSFKYLYVGYNPSGNNVIDNLEIDTMTLEIHGLQAMYSKTNYKQAEMKYVTLNRNLKDEADIIIPNGVYITNLPKENNDLALGFVYDFASNDSDRLGVVQNAQNVDVSSYFEDVKSVVGDLKTHNADVDYNNILTGFEYQKTNQGSIWLETNDSFDTNNSFYYYNGSNAITTDDLFDAENKPKFDKFTNTTSFSNIGYYLVFVNVTLQELNEDFYQVFAFQYATSTTQIEVTDVDGKIISAKQYTSSNIVNCYVEKPGVFDREIEVNYYYKKYGNTYSGTYTKDDIITTTPHNINLRQLSVENGKYHVQLGAEIGANEAGTYLLEICSKGEQSGAYRTFSIDRQPITGVSAYTVVNQSSNNDVIYAFGEQIIGGIMTSSKGIYSTLFWDNKPSGAKINVTYTYTPFVINNDEIGQCYYNNEGELWFNTNYSLGATSGEFTLNRAPSLYGEVSVGDCLAKQGIYLFTLVDDAGNYCKYMLVIDNTPAYIKVEDEYLNASNTTFDKDVTITAPTHKAISLGNLENAGSTLSTDLYKILKGDYTEYYDQFGTNITNITSHFARANGQYYVKVKMQKLYEYDTIGALKSSILINKKLEYKMTYDDSDKGTSMIRYYYLIGENQQGYLYNAKDSNSYVIVEINKDKSRLEVHYDDNIIAGSNACDNNNRLQTKTELNAAFATNANYLAVTWNRGEGALEVVEVKYQYYALQFNKADYNAGTYFYKLISNVTLYQDGVWDNGANIDVDNVEKGFALINVSNGRTQPGYYIVTRTYRSANNIGEDKQVRNYHFIVDRNGVMEIKNNIHISLLENETAFNTFTKTTTSIPPKFTYAQDDIYNQPYTSYLTTNKVPVTINIPVGKYALDGVYSNYYAGRLVFDVYFVDNNSQLSANNLTYKLFSVDGPYANQLSNSQIYVEDGITYYQINVREQVNQLLSNGNLSNWSAELLGKFIYQDNQADWMCLPGDYVIVINDLVIGNKDHKAMIAFTVNKADASSSPKTQVYTGADNNINLLELGKTTNVNIVTSQKYVKVLLPEYQSSSTQANIDDEYIVLSRSIDCGRPVSLIGENTSLFASSYITIDGLNKILTLESPYTDMRNIQYEITIRYKVKTASKDYSNCYYYYDLNGTRHTYAYTTYRITIDRIAPDENITSLVKNDSFANYYLDNADMFESAYYESGNTGVYFVNRYAKYYSTNNVADLYALNVNKNTLFLNTKNDVESIKFVAYNRGARLELPVTNYSGYTTVSNVNKIKTYGDIFNNSNYGYYIVLEVDRAGNTTQYIVYYNDVNLEVWSMMFGAKKFDANQGKIVDDATVLIDLGATSEMETVFDLTLTNASVNGFTAELQDNFYHFEIYNLSNNISNAFNTNFATSFDASGLLAQIVNSIKTMGYGNYALDVLSRKLHHSATINYVQANKTLTIANLIKEDANGNKYIDLSASNIVENGVTYFAEEIALQNVNTDTTSTYLCYPAENYIYKLNGEVVNDGKVYHLDGTYILTMKDMFGKISKIRFNTSGKDPHQIYFDGPNAQNYYLYNNVYYGYQTATIEFENGLYTPSISYTINGTTLQVDGNLAKYNDVEIIKIQNGKVTIKPYYADDVNYVGLSYSVIINLVLKDDADEVFTYELVMDSEIQNVTLRDMNSAEQTMRVDINKDYDKTVNTTSTSGTMNLVWLPTENDHFNYRYILHEIVSYVDNKPVFGEAKEYDEVNNITIKTDAESQGVYIFEIVVLTKDNKVKLGNKLYTFAVKSNRSAPFTVVAGVVPIEPNAEFKMFEDLFDKENSYNPLLTGLNRNQFRTNLGIEEDEFENFKNDPIKLYISNQPMSVILDDSQGMQKAQYTLNWTNYQFTIYRIYANNYNIYIGTLYCFNSQDEVIDESSIKVNNSKIENVLYHNSEVKLTFETKRATDNRITQKNEVIIDVYHNGVWMESVKDTSYIINGEGNYSFTFTDLAGNKHIFANGDSFVNVSTLRQVYLTINGKAPIDNAYYNGRVDLAVYDYAMYDEITIKVMKNGASYTPSKTLQTYTFTESGTYRVIVTGRIKQEEYKKTLVFTIINPLEARSSIDLTGLMRYATILVLDGEGRDITNEFKAIMNSGNSGMLITFDDLIESNLLSLSAGKQTYTLTYLVHDGKYPNRIETFTFCMNDEEPSIKCSLKAGESSKKQFTLTFNPGIVYDQVGEAYLYINDKAVMKIDQNSSYETLVEKFTQKEYGSGDYYIKLVSPSGTVVWSHKVVLKESLNVWAIIIIVVATAVVITIITSIIILRRKMRIR